MLDKIKQEIVDAAKAYHEKYPQYEGHWDGPEWELVVATRDIHTKMGLALATGEYTIGKLKSFPRGTPDKPEGRTEFYTIYSLRNKIDTAVRKGDVVFLTAPDTTPDNSALLEKEYDEAFDGVKAMIEALDHELHRIQVEDEEFGKAWDRVAALINTQKELSAALKTLKDVD